MPELPEVETVRKALKNKVLNKIKWIATRGIFIVAYIILLNVLQASQAFAADDPLTVINNLSYFMCFDNFISFLLKSLSIFIIYLQLLIFHVINQINFIT